MIITLVAVILIILFPSPPQSGWQGDGTPLYTIAQGHVKGGVYMKGGHGLTYENPYQEYFDVPDGEVMYARLYVPLWNYDPGDTLNATINGNALDRKKEPDYVAAWGIAGYCWNATSFIRPGMNDVTVSYKNPNGGPYCITLVVVYQDPALPHIRFWINEGNYVLTYHYNYRQDSTTTTFSGSVPGNHATLHTLIIAGNKGETDRLYLDSTLIASDVGRSETGKYFDLNRFDITLNKPETIVKFERGDEGYIHPFVAVLVSESEPVHDSITINKQQSVRGTWDIPYEVIAVCLIVIIVIVLRYRKKTS